MAIDFNGTTSKLENTGGTDFSAYTVISVLVWVYADTTGEGALGNVFHFPEDANSGNQGLRYHDATNMGWQSDRATTHGQWKFAASTGQWNAVGLSYDNTDVANDPVTRVNFASVTPSRENAPVGAALAPGSGYCVGNNTAQTRTWDGAIAHLQVFNVILTASEMDMGLRRPGSVRRGLTMWLPMYDANHIQDWSGNVNNGTATALTTRDGPPCQSPYAAWAGWQGAYTIATVAGQPTSRRREQVPFLSPTRRLVAGYR